jgi:hypothetical protein
MHFSRPFRRYLCALTTLLGISRTLSPAAGPEQGDLKFPYAERLSYRIEWRMVTAGEALLQLSPTSSQEWGLNLNLQSAGFVSKLYKVLDTYKMVSNDRFCGQSSAFDEQEGKRHSWTVVQFDNTRHRLTYTAKDLVKDTVQKEEIDIQPCTYETLGALGAIRQMRLEPGKTVNFPMTNGKKCVNVKVEAQARESLTIAGKKCAAIRYQAFLFDNVLYRRKGRLFIWMTDDAERVPVQIQVQTGFPIGTVTLELEKREKL